MSTERPIDRLLSVMERLRSKDGCPWDLKQTFSSLKPYIIEEAYEAVEAIDTGTEALADELGDLLLQIVFVCQIAKENNLFDFDTVATGISEKLIRRHPHVFDDTSVKDAEEVVQNWNKIKKEKEQKKHLLDGIPTAMPATLLTQRYADRAASVGFDWGSWQDVLPKIDEELAELQEAITLGDSDKIFHEMGDVIAACVNLSRKLGINSEEALRHCALRFRERIDQMERLDPSLIEGKMSLEEMEALWQRAKKELTKL